MAQNSKFTEPRETRATAMNRADVYRELYNAVEFNLFGAGSISACAGTAVNHYERLFRHLEGI